VLRPRTQNGIAGSSRFRGIERPCSISAGGGAREARRANRRRRPSRTDWRPRCRPPDGPVTAAATPACHAGERRGHPEARRAVCARTGGECENRRLLRRADRKRPRDLGRRPSERPALRRSGRRGARRGSWTSGSGELASRRSDAPGPGALTQLRIMRTLIQRCPPGTLETNADPTIRRPCSGCPSTPSGSAGTPAPPETADSETAIRVPRTGRPAHPAAGENGLQPHLRPGGDAVADEEALTSKGCRRLYQRAKASARPSSRTTRPSAGRSPRCAAARGGR